MTLDFRHNTERQLAYQRGLAQEYIDTIPPTERDLETFSPEEREIILRRYQATRKSVASIYGDDFDDEEDER